MKKLIQKLLTIGKKVNTPRRELKKIQILNYGCLAWLFIGIIMIFVNQSDSHSYHRFLAHLISIGIALLVLYLQHKQLFFISRIIFLMFALVKILIFAFFLHPGSFIELFLILIPIVSLILFDNIWLNISALLVAFGCFLLSIIFFNNYSNINLSLTLVFILFLTTFLTFNYFRNLNENNEIMLEKQHAREVEIRNKIESQRKELEELNLFQSHFLVNLSHEIRTPLTLIKGNSSLILKESSIDAVLSLNRRISDNAEKIQLLSDNIMDLAKMNAGKLKLIFKKTPIISFCNRLFNSFEPIYSQKNIQYSFKDLTRDTMLICDIDKLYLERVFNNLFINAYNYTPENGAIVFTVSYESKVVILSLEDSGCGISDADLPYIFDSFYRGESKKNVGGTGIGLSFAKEILALHRGTIKVYSTEGVGSTFTILLPAEIDNSEPTKVIHETTRLTDNKNNFNILLVEDNKEMRDFLKGILDLNNNIKEASNGIEALDLVNNCYFDIIITDYMMPEMNGYEFIKEVKKLNLDTPIIVLTANTNKKNELDFLRIGIDDYITKPFNEEELHIRINKCTLNYKERRNFISKNNSEICFDDQELIILKILVEDRLQDVSFGVSDFADLAAVTERTLHRKIKSLTGLTPNMFIREIKLQRAREIYEKKEAQSHKELAAKVGFKNSNHLIKLYQERFGNRPQV